MNNSDGVPLPGVSVILKGTTNGTTTDSDGKFRLLTPAEGEMFTTHTQGTAFIPGIIEECVGLF